MKSVITLLSGCCLITLLSGCASVLCGPKQSVAINSKPVGADVQIYNANGEIIFHKTTPCVAKLDRRAPELLESATYVILVKKEGYAPVQVPLMGTVNRAYFANILFGGLGLAIDPMTGSMWTLSPAGIDPTLAEQTAALFSHEDGLMIALKEQVPQELVGYLQPVQK